MDIGKILECGRGAAGVLGGLVMWEANDAAGYTRRTFWSGVSEVNLDMPPEPTVAAIARRVAATLSSGDWRVEALFRRADGGSALVWLDRAASSSDARVEYTQRASVVISADGEVVLAEGPDEITGPIKRAWNREWDALTARDVASVLRTAITGRQIRGLALKRHGGIYWVPASRLDKVYELRGAVAQFNPESRIDVWAVADTAHNRTEATVAVGMAVLDRVAEAIDRAHEFVGKCRSAAATGRKISSLAVEAVEREFAEAEAVLGTYASVIGGTEYESTARDRIREARAMVDAAIAEREALEVA